MTQLSIQISSNGKYFEFEQQLNADLSCPPLAARQKLDALGIKISRNQWLALEMNERCQVRDMPAASNAEKREFAEFVNRIIKERSGESPTRLSTEQQAAAVPTDELPATIAEEARELGYELDAMSWRLLDYDQRYALLKFGSDPRRRRKFAAALKEFLANP
jgi:hypothetical protein